MLGFTIFYLGFAYFISDLGAIGMIYANIFSMIIRIMYSSKEMFKFYPYLILSDVVPSLDLASSFVISYLILNIFANYLDGIILIGLGGIVGLLHLTYIYVKERSSWISLKSKIN